MKTFREFLLTEVEHFAGQVGGGTHEGDWGVINPRGRIISGLKHPAAEAHDYFLNRVKNSNEYARYRHTDKGLNITTYDNKKSVGAAVKAYHNLPHHKNNQVEHEHEYLHSHDPGQGMHFKSDIVSGHKAKIYNHLVNYYNNFKHRGIPEK